MITDNGEEPGPGRSIQVDRIHCCRHRHGLGSLTCECSPRARMTPLLSVCRSITAEVTRFAIGDSEIMLPAGWFFEPIRHHMDAFVARIPRHVRPSFGRVAVTVGGTSLSCLKEEAGFWQEINRIFPNIRELRLLVCYSASVHNGLFQYVAGCLALPNVTKIVIQVHQEARMSYGEDELARRQCEAMRRVLSTRAVTGSGITIDYEEPSEQYVVRKPGAKGQFGYLVTCSMSVTRTKPTSATASVDKGWPQRKKLLGKPLNEDNLYARMRLGWRRLLSYFL
jgi:hypothetical protein